MYTMIIADDEEIERKALCLLIQKELPEISVIGLAENGAELISMVEEKLPDMAIVDVNMPSINGIDAVELLRSHRVSTHFIINTAYSDFAYVQRALTLKVDDYILKPQKRSETINTLKKLCRSIDEARANTKSQRQIQELFWQIQPVIESEIMYSIFINEPSCTNLATWCEMHAISWNMGVMVSLILENKDDESMKTQIKSALYSSLHGTMEASCACLSTITETSINLLIFIPERESEDVHNAIRWLSDIMQVLLDHLKRNNGLKMRAGIGQIYSDFQQMTQSYHESLLALKEIGAHSVSFYKPNTDAEMLDKQLSLLADNLMMLVRTKSERSTIDASLNSAEHLLLADATVPLRLWNMCQQLMLDTTDDVSLRAFFRLAGHALAQEKETAKQIQMLGERLYRLDVLLQEQNGMGASPYVVQTLQFMEKHYDSDISLEQAAKESSISPFYLSRLVKAQLGKTFVEYLTQVRMQKAMELARTTRLSIKEIAEQTGYPNPTYFCRVFKKYTGCTIGEMREQNR